jgi:hypothetical protein
VITPADLLAVSETSYRALEPLLDSPRWNEPAGDLDWTCTRTLDHIADALSLYSGNLATRTQVQRARMRDGNPTQPLPAMLATTATVAAILAAVGRDAPPGTRAYHPAGLADVSGFMAMGCAEILIHSEDICLGLGGAFRGPDEVTVRVVRRLFPWAPPHDDPWELLRWSMGRAPLPDHRRLAPDWWWQCAPLDEWDGTMRARTVPPAWR